MPAGINVEIDGPYARISFPDLSKKGPALKALLDTGSPIELRTGGLRREYIVPEGNARAAGLVDEVVSSEDPTDAGPADGEKTDIPNDEPSDQAHIDVPSGDPVPENLDGHAPGLEKPTIDSLRKEIDAYGASLTPPIDTTEATNKTAALKLLGITTEESNA